VKYSPSVGGVTELLSSCELFKTWVDKGLEKMLY